MSDTPEHRCWFLMRSRCYNKNLAHYKNYGAKGIVVCDRWLESFQNFFDDMGKKPSPKHSIERLDSRGNYCPENCVWADRITQNNNTSRNHWLLVNGERKTIAQWARARGISKNTIMKRLRSGWAQEKAVNEPVNKALSRVRKPLISFVSMHPESLFQPVCGIFPKVQP